MIDLHGESGVFLPVRGNVRATRRSRVGEQTPRRRDPLPAADRRPQLRRRRGEVVRPVLGEVGCLHGGAHDPARRRLVDRARERQDLAEARDVRGGGLREGEREPPRAQHVPCVPERVARDDPQQQLLPRGPHEVAVVVPVARERERLVAVELLVAGLQVDVRVVRRGRADVAVEVPLVDREPDAADLVDEILEPVEVDLDEVVDLDPERVPHDAGQQPLAAVLERHVDAVMAVPRDRHVQVAWDREERDPVPLRLDPREHDRVGAGTRAALPAVVGADQQDRLRRRLGRQPDERMRGHPVQLGPHRADDRALRPSVQLVDRARSLPVGDTGRGADEDDDRRHDPDDEPPHGQGRHRIPVSAGGVAKRRPLLGNGVGVLRIDTATGNLVAGRTPIFPLGLSDPPPVDGTAPGGRPAWAEIADAGVTFVRHYDPWTRAAAGEQLANVRHKLDVAHAHGLQVWLALAGVDQTLAQRGLLDEIVRACKGHPGLGVWKGADEPAHARVPAAGLVAVHEHVRALDPDHPLAIIEAPRNPAATKGGRDRVLTAAALRPYAGACDVHGVDIYPVSFPPGKHAGRANKDISVVGDVTRIVAEASPQKAIWTTLQIAWSGVLPPRNRVVFPTLQQARFMAYDAVVAGARGLFFFGGHLLPVLSPQDRVRGWNWTYWRKVQRPLVEELAGPQHVEALVAPAAPFTVEASAPDVALSARQTRDSIYLIAVRRSPSATGRIRFRGLPAGIGEGTVLAHGPSNPPRHVAVKGGAFTDASPYRPHNARVYRFPRV